MEVSIEFLYQVIGKKEVENAALREALVQLQGEVTAIKADLAAASLPTTSEPQAKSTRRRSAETQP